MKKNDDRVLFSPTEGKNKSKEFDIPFALSDKEKEIFPLLVSADSVVLKGKAVAAGNTFALTISCNGKVKRKDSHDLSLLTLPIQDEIELVLSPDKEVSDIERDKDGNYDLRGSILTLLRNAIPQNYSKTKLKKIVTEDYTLLSEEEYYKEKHSGSNSPFADLDKRMEEKDGK